MGVTVRNVADAAAVLARVGLVLTQRLFESGDAGKVLGVQGHIVDPAGAAVAGVAAVNGGHRQGDEERCGSIRDHFRDAGFDQQIQAEGQIGGACVAVSIRLGQGDAVVIMRIAFQGVLDRD